MDFSAHQRKKNAQTCLTNGRTDLAGADLSINVRLLPDAVLQVRDVGLEPVPVADDGSSLHGVAALCSLPSAREEKKKKKKMTRVFKLL